MLDITTNEQQDLPIKIDGKEYLMKSYNSLAFKDFMVLQNFSNKYKDIIDGDMSKLNDKELDALANSMEGMCTLILKDVPEEVLGRLNVNNKLALITHFIESVPKDKMDNGTENNGESFQNSQGTMESVLKNG